MDLEFFCRLVALFDRHISDVERIRRRAREHVDTEVFHETHLAFRIARRHGKHGKTTTFAALVSAKTTREQTIAVSNLQHGIGAAICCIEEASEAIAPHFKVFFSVTNHGCRACCARRAVNASDLASWYREHAERIGVAQVLLHREREFAQIVERGDVFRFNACLIERLAIEGNALIDISDQLLETLKLKCVELLTWHRF